MAVPAAAPAADGVPAYTAEEPPRNRTGLYVGLLVVLLLLVAGILFFIGRNLGSSTKQVVVPNVVGQSALDATNALTAAGFKVSSSTRERHDPGGPGLRPGPEGKRQGRRGLHDQIIVSSGVGKVNVPNTVGLSQAAAESLLKNGDLIPNVVDEASDTVPKGQVIDQAPAAGTQQDKGSVVTIKVSSGVAQVTVPSVAGGDLASASATLGAAGFKVTSSQQSSTSVAAGTVINTNPAAGTKVAKGSTVNVIGVERSAADHDHDGGADHHRPRRPPSTTPPRPARDGSAAAAVEEVRRRAVAADGEDRLGVELHALDVGARGGAGP